MSISVSALFLLPFLHADPLAGTAMASGQLYLDPDMAQSPVVSNAGRNVRSATLDRRADGEIQLRIEGGFRMEMRASVDASGQLTVNCGAPDHPGTPHVHAAPESAQ